MNTIASNLLAKREEKRFKQSYVAEQCGMSQPNYSNIERGETSPSIDQLRKFAEVFGTTVEELIADRTGNDHGNLTPLKIHKKTLTESDKDIYIKILENQVRTLMTKKKKGQ